MTTIIGLTGGRGAGKDTVAAHLISMFGGRRYVIARELKELTLMAYNLPGSAVHGSQDDKEVVHAGISGRQGMERLGKSIRDVFGATFLVSRCCWEIAGDRPRLAVVSDVRFLAEHRQLIDFAAEADIKYQLWRVDPAPGLKSYESDDVSNTEWKSLQVDRAISPSVPGLEHLREILAQAAEANSLRPPCLEQTWFGEDRIGQYAWCQEDKGHVLAGDRFHRDERGRTWTCSTDKGWV